MGRQGRPGGGLKRKVTPDMENQPQKKRGRPAGSKNKPKEISPARPKPNSRLMAEISADPSFQDDSYHDSGDKCNICQFSLNNPIKKNKQKTKCPVCSRTVHAPCLKKDPCQCALIC